MATKTTPKTATKTTVESPFQTLMYEFDHADDNQRLKRLCQVVGYYEGLQDAAEFVRTISDEAAREIYKRMGWFNADYKQQRTMRAR